MLVCTGYWLFQPKWKFHSELVKHIISISGRLSMQRFWATDGNQKCAVFVFNFSSHYHINDVKSLFTSRYDQFENLRETTVLACEIFTSSVRPWLKNVACLSPLMMRYIHKINEYFTFHGHHCTTIIIYSRMTTQKSAWKNWIQILSRCTAVTPSWTALKLVLR